MMERKGQLTATIFIGIAVALIILILGLTGGFKLIFSKGFVLYAIGGAIIVFDLIYIIPAAISGKFNKTKRNFTLAILVIGIFVLISGFFVGSFQNTSFNGPAGTYIQAPTFYFYKCDAASAPVESTHVTMTDGSSAGFITAPKNAASWDLWVSQTEKTHWYSNDRRFVYQICHNNGANCDPQVFINAGSLPFNQKNIPSLHLPNNLITDRIYVDYQGSGFSGWTDRANGAEWYQTYTPFILWKTDMFGGGSNPYTTPDQGCNFPSGTSSSFINSVSNFKPQIHSQSSTSDTSLPFYGTRNFIGTYVPLSTENVNFVTYNGNQGYCLNKEIFAISTVKTNGGTYQIVDNSFNTAIAPSVTCCPGDSQPNQYCGNDFAWHENLSTKQCSAFNACAGANWMPSGSKNLIRYNCINSQCVAETKQVSCTSNADCGNNQICDTLNYVCANVGTGTVVNDSSGNVTESEQSCNAKSVASPLLGYTWIATSTQPSLFKQIITLGNAQATTSGYCSAQYVPYYIFGSIVLVLGIILALLLRSPRRRR